MKSNAKAKSFHVTARGNPPQHVTSPSRILMATRHEGWQRQWTSINISGITNGPPTGHQDIESTTIPIRAIHRAINRAINRAILRAINRAIRRAINRAIRRARHRHGAANEPRYASNDERDVG